jgi:hypothetical protein
MNIKMQCSHVPIINVNFVTVLIITRPFESLTKLLQMKSENSSRYIKFNESYNYKK